ncbi:PIM1 kinase, partial [Peucedramus taeniatus]|nr:PIM1 kinase [Peucedramus taeniatus]
ALQERHQLGSLLGRGGFGSVYMGAVYICVWRMAPCLTDGILVFLQSNGTRVPLETELLDKVSTGLHSVVQLLDWFELCHHFLLVMKCPERSQDLFDIILLWGLLSEEVVQGLFRHVLEAVRHCSSCEVLHRDTEPDNILLNLASGEAKLVDFGCGTYLQ